MLVSLGGDVKEQLTVNIMMVNASPQILSILLFVVLQVREALQFVAIICPLQVDVNRTLQ